MFLKIGGGTITCTSHISIHDICSPPALISTGQQDAVQALAIDGVPVV